jgi:hypothetical protein
MKCGRCDRAIAYEQFFGSQEHFWRRRCIFCGEIIEDVIMENLQWLKRGIVSGNKNAQSALSKRYEQILIQIRSIPY